MATKNADVVARGGLLVTVLMDGPTPGTAPTKSNLDAWVGTPRLPYTAVIDNIGTPDSFIDFYGCDKENYFIYDLATMTLVSHSASDVKAALGALDNLLPRGDGGARSDGGL